MTKDAKTPAPLTDSEVDDETLHCEGCGETYDPFAESHVGHEDETDRG